MELKRSDGTIVLSVRPDTVEDLWFELNAKITRGNQKLSPFRAGEVAAAIIYDQYVKEWERFEKEVEELVRSLDVDDHPMIELYDELTGWTPKAELIELSGTRTLLDDYLDADVLKLGDNL